MNPRSVGNLALKTEPSLQTPSLKDNVVRYLALQAKLADAEKKVKEIETQLSYVKVKLQDAVIPGGKQRLVRIGRKTFMVENPLNERVVRVVEMKVE